MTFERPKNLLLITADDLDCSAIGFVSDPPIALTPNLDALAERSFRLIHNRAVSAICMPSRTAMLSGRVPHKSGAKGFLPVAFGVPTLVTQLRSVGYYTACLHKVNHMQPARAFPWDFQFTQENRHTKAQAQALELAIAEARTLGMPFFINCNLDDPHRPFYGSPEAAARDQSFSGPYAIEAPVTPEEVVVPPHLDDLPEVRTELAQYWSSVRRMDKTLGNVLAALEKSGAAEDTAVMFCADHGMPFPFAKATCYDHGTRIPALVSWPGLGTIRTIDSLTVNTDITPTILDLLDVDALPESDGQSWLPLLTGDRVAGRDFIVTQIDHVVSGVNYGTRAIQTGTHSLVFEAWSDNVLERRIEAMSGLTFNAMKKAAETDPAIAARIEQYVFGIPLAFYDLVADPGQRRNRIDDPACADEIARLKERLLAEMVRTGDPLEPHFRAALEGGTLPLEQNPERYRARG